MPGLSKAELKRQVKRFCENKERGISLALFADLCGVSKHHFFQVFLHEAEPLTENLQRRVNKAFEAVKNGEVRVMQRKDKTRFIEYRREPKPVFLPKMGLKMTSEGLKVSVGMVNRHDYSQPDLDEQLRGSKWQS